MKKIPIERKANLTQQEFLRDHVHNGGKPVIVTDATAHWPAMKKWTFDFFKETYGSDFATAPLGLLGEVSKMTRVKDYITHLDSGGNDAPGFWVDAKTGRPLREPPKSLDVPAYLLGWHAFQEHPELYDDIQPALYFVPDWVLSLEPAVRDLMQRTSGREYWSIYIGPKNSLSQMHQDFWKTHACLAQIQGSKKAMLFAPGDDEFLYGGALDPENPDFEKHPLLANATAYEGEIGPGDVLFIPSNWWHWVRGLEKSVTVSHNFFNEVNFSEHLNGIFRNIPSMAKAVEALPELREALNVKWKSKGFEQ